MTTWIYSQSTGNLYAPDGALVEAGYSGSPPFVNRPRAEGVKNQGPIPTGTYDIGDAFDHDTLGPCSMPLEPDPDNEMYGRDGFYIHGDTQEMNQTASTGCIILSRPTRDMIAASPVHVLEVEP